MIVIPFTRARTSRRRFTLLNVFNAAEISSLETPQSTAKAAAAVAFQTLYSPASENSKSAQGSLLRSTVQVVRAGSKRRFVIRHADLALVPYRSTGQNARSKQRSRLSP